MRSSSPAHLHINETIIIKGSAGALRESRSFAQGRGLRMGGRERKGKRPFGACAGLEIIINALRSSGRPRRSSTACLAQDQQCLAGAGSRGRCSDAVILPFQTEWFTTASLRGSGSASAFCSPRVMCSRDSYTLSLLVFFFFFCLSFSRKLIIFQFPNSTRRSQCRCSKVRKGTNYFSK